ncbi:MAG: 2'-deoxycytidine 5'-triphosphate deaminase [Alphaproteobacteria bacterium]|nr:2'-deoxycytidine 5'-triphosphate deaminase [Alphaproteobacteria bacterium]
MSKPADNAPGILVSQQIAAMLRAGQIKTEIPVEPGQLQPASLDLRLGAVAYRVRASFMPGPRTQVMDKVGLFGMHQIDLTQGAVLEKGCVYIVPLMEALALPAAISAIANPKSSTGRLDVFTRVITDRGDSFDRIQPGYAGALYAEIAPRTFSIKVRQGSRLGQIRFVRDAARAERPDLPALHRARRLVDAAAGEEVLRDNLLGVTLDLEGDARTGLVGYRAKPHADVIDVDRRGACDPAEFWEPIPARRGRGLILHPDDFYILATRECVAVPPDYAAEMIAYDTMVGEFRVHYAGFFDPGFGWTPDPAVRHSRGVLEVRSHEVPFLLEHGQIVGWLRYEKLAAKPETVYGEGALGSHYQRQGLALSKHFKPWG